MILKSRGAEVALGEGVTKRKAITAVVSEAYVILEDALHNVISPIQLWWTHRYFIAANRKAERIQLRTGAENSDLRTDLLSSSAEILEIARLEALCRKFDVPFPTRRVTKKQGGFEVVTEHWYRNDEQRRKVLAELTKARKARLELQRNWLVAVTGAVGAFTGLLAIVLS